MKLGILGDKFKLKQLQGLYFVFEHWFRDIKGQIEGTHGISKLKLNLLLNTWCLRVCSGHSPNSPGHRVHEDVWPTLAM